MLEVASEPVNARLPGEETINRHPPASSTKLGKIDRLTRDSPGGSKPHNTCPREKESKTDACSNGVFKIAANALNIVKYKVVS